MTSVCFSLISLSFVDLISRVLPKNPGWWRQKGCFLPNTFMGQVWLGPAHSPRAHIWTFSPTCLFLYFLAHCHPLLRVMFLPGSVFSCPPTARVLEMHSHGTVKTAEPSASITSFSRHTSSLFESGGLCYSHKHPYNIWRAPKLQEESLFFWTINNLLSFNGTSI